MVNTCSDIIQWSVNKNHRQNHITVSTACLIEPFRNLQFHLQKLDTSICIQNQAILEHFRYQISKLTCWTEGTLINHIVDICLRQISTMCWSACEQITNLPSKSRTYTADGEKLPSCKGLSIKCTHLFMISATTDELT